MKSDEIPEYCECGIKKVSNLAGEFECPRCLEEPAQFMSGRPTYVGTIHMKEPEPGHVASTLKKWVEKGVLQECLNCGEMMQAGCGVECPNCKWVSPCSTER